ncbi:MAG: tetratricopeptide repeat protein [Acidobacteriia bacterium]|nr:tetratricopeptide repeat protein [Terriglobia bacterium]
MTERAKCGGALLAALAALILLAGALAAQTRATQAEARQHYSLAQDLLKQGQRDKAVAELRAAIRLAPEYIEAHNDYIANQQGKPADLAAEYEGYLKQHPQSGVFHYLAGKAYSKAGRPKDAEAEYQKSLQLSPGFSWALLELGAAALNNQDKAKAGDFYERARVKAANNVRLHMTLSTKLNSVGKYPSALAEVQRALKLDPTFFEAYPTLWRTKMRLTSGSEKTQADIRQDIRNLQSRYPKNPKALEAAMNGYGIFFESEEADRVRKAIVAIDPKYFGSSGGGTRLMMVAPSGEQLTFSGPDLDRIMQAAPLTDPKAQLAAYQQMEKEIGDQNLKLHVLYAREAGAYLKTGDLENAERLMAVMEKGGARVVSLQQQLASYYVDHKIKLDLARDYTLKAIEEARNNLKKLESTKGMESSVTGQKAYLANLLYTQGRLLLAQDLTREAAGPLAESVQLSEREASALDLGLTYAKLNRTDDAIKALAIACSFDGPKKQEAMKALEGIYGDRENARPLAALINEAVEKRKATSRDTAVRSDPASALEGKAAPPFELASVAGQKVSLSDYQGKVILLNFWATW